MSKSKKIMSTAGILTLAIVAVFVYPSFVSADQGFDGGVAFPDVEIELKPSLVYERAAHVANGVALRNRIEGTIHLRGVPVGAKIVEALLYITILDTKEVGAENVRIVFNGNRRNAVKVADSEDPCWSPTAGTHTYRSVVTPFIPKARPNQDYEVTFIRGSIATNGENPWDSFNTEENLLEGATLIMIYRADDTVGTVWIYDAFNNSMFSSNGTFTLFHASFTGPALFTMTGADGQRGGGYSNGLANETTTFNGALIAGPGADAVGGISASDWDGSTGWPLPQLWDVQTHIVGVDGVSSTVVYESNGDCLVPAAMVIDAQ